MSSKEAKLQENSLKMTKKEKIAWITFLIAWTSATCFGYFVMEKKFMESLEYSLMLIGVLLGYFWLVYYGSENIIIRRGSSFLKKGRKIISSTISVFAILYPAFLIYSFTAYSWITSLVFVPCLVIVIIITIGLCAKSSSHDHDTNSLPC